MTGKTTRAQNSFRHSLYTIFFLTFCYTSVLCISPFTRSSFFLLYLCPLQSSRTGAGGWGSSKGGNIVDWRDCIARQRHAYLEHIPHDRMWNRMLLCVEYLNGEIGTSDLLICFVISWPVEGQGIEPPCHTNNRVQSFMPCTWSIFIFAILYFKIVQL